MDVSLIQLITEEDEDLLSIDIYESFPYLKEEKQKFNEQAKLICSQFLDNQFEDEETLISSDKNEQESEESSQLSSNSFTSINESESLYNSRQNSQTNKFFSTNQQVDISSQNEITKGANLNQSTYDSINNNYEDERVKRACFYSTRPSANQQSYLEFSKEDMEIIHQKANQLDSTNQQGDSSFQDEIAKGASLNYQICDSINNNDFVEIPKKQSKYFAAANQQLYLQQSKEEKAISQLEYQFYSSNQLADDNSFQYKIAEDINLNKQTQDSINNNYDGERIKRAGKFLRASRNQQQKLGLSKEQKVLKQKRDNSFLRSSQEQTEKTIFQRLLDYVLCKITEVIKSETEKNNFYEFFGLDNSIIDFDQIKLEDDNRITYKDKQDLKTVTFLISGYLSQNLEASINFVALDNIQNKECQDNLFIFFKWSNSSIWKVLYKFLLNIQNKYEPCLYRQYLRQLIEDCLTEKFNENIMCSIFPLLIIFEKLIKMFGSTTLNSFIDTVEKLLDASIQDFQDTYALSKIGGEVLAENINKQSILRRLNIDFLGHSLGTVVIAYALINLKQNARYLMLFGGAATVSEIENCHNKFQKGYNFYSSSDRAIQALVKTKVIGDKQFIGANTVSVNQNFLNKDTQLLHIQFMLEYQKLYDEAKKDLNEENKNW
ncbi:hypothetical protein ABPG74_003110 [Tetrahymena malaccensis]